MSKTDQNQTSRIIDILASGNPNHGLKEAVHSALSERVGIVLDELKNVVAESYFGQSAQADLEEDLAEAFETSADDHAHKVAHVTRALKAQGHKPVGEYNIDAGSSGGSHHETRITYNHATDGKKYNKWVRTRARYGKADAAEKDGLAESDLQELSPQLLRRAAQKADEKGNMLAHTKGHKDPEVRARWGQSMKMAHAAASKEHAATSKSIPSFRNLKNRLGKGEKIRPKFEETMGEESNLQELSRRTMANYITKAHVSGLKAAADGENAYMTGAKKNAAKIRATNLTGHKREMGINRAAAKLAKEDTDLQELSSKTLQSYKSKSQNDIDSMIKKLRGKNYRDVSPDKLKNRAAGIRSATRKLKKEDTDLQELSKKTLGSYIKKASHDVAHKGAITREYANRAEKDRKDGNYVGGRKNAELSDKTFNKSWKRRQGMAKAVDKLTKD